MFKFSFFILVNILGWKIINNFPNIKRSVIIFAPHTSYLDALYGKLYVNIIEINHKFLSKKELFFFPMNIVMKLYGAMPIRGIEGQNSIIYVSKILKDSQSLHVIISPEGTRSKVTRWNKGFYLIALKSEVPIIVAFIDYKKKEIGIKGVINNLENYDEVIKTINSMYKNVCAKHPNNFAI